MTITPQQRDARRGWVGSSDTPILCGVAPDTKEQRTVYDLWLDKSGHLVDDEMEGDHLDFGNAIETAIIEMVAKRTQLDIRPVTTSFRKGALGAHIDGGIFTGEKLTGILEVKTTAVGGYGPDGSSEIPQHVWYQVQHQMECCDLDFCVVACLHMRGFAVTLTMHHIERDRIAGETIRERAEWFWKHVEGGFPPPDVAPSRGVASRIIPDGTTVEIPQAVIDEYNAAREAYSEAEERKKVATEELRRAMGLAKVGVGSVHQVSVTTVNTRSINSKMLRDQFPEIASQVTKESSYSRLYVKEVA